MLPLACIIPEILQIQGSIQIHYNILYHTSKTDVVKNKLKFSAISKWSANATEKQRIAIVLHFPSVSSYKEENKILNLQTNYATMHVLRIQKMSQLSAGNKQVRTNHRTLACLTCPHCPLVSAARQGTVQIRGHPSLSRWHSVAHGHHADLWLTTTPAQCRQCWHTQNIHCFIARHIRYDTFTCARKLMIWPS